MSAWVHLMCGDCWNRARGGTPTRIADDKPGPCCFCGETTESGIYVRANPETTHCQGRGPEHESEEP